MIPQKIRQYYRGILGLSVEKSMYFRNSCRLYNISQTCGMYEPTLMLAYMVSAVECLAKSEKIRFSEFMKQYLQDEYDKVFAIFYMEIYVQDIFIREKYSLQNIT